MLEHLPTAAPSGAAVLVDMRAMDGLLDRLHNGDPTKGWEGDTALFLAFNRPSQRWELWRQEGGESSLVGRSKPGHPFPSNLIEELVARDVRRGFKPWESVDAHNRAVDAQRQYEQEQRMGPAIDKLAWALAKDDRTGAGL